MTSLTGGPEANDRHSQSRPSTPRGARWGWFVALRVIGVAVVNSITEITVLGSARHRVEGDLKHVEQVILDAARGSIMEFAWLTEAETGESLVINPERVVMLRAAGS